MRYRLHGHSRKGNTNYVFKIERCWKCSGSGLWRGPSPGECFTCHGTGNLGVYSPTEEWAAVLAGRREAKRAREAAKEAAKGAAFINANPWLLTVAFYYGATKNPVARTVLAWAARGEAPTFKMLRAVYLGVCSTLIKLAEPPEKTAPVITGKGVEVSGEVVSVKERETPYGWTLKMLVKDERGFKVWGTVPKAVRTEVERGCRVSFIANVEASNDDECFGFFSRPRKAALLAA